MVGKPCVTHRSVIRSYKYYGEDNAEATQGTCNMINRHQRLGASNKDKRGAVDAVIWYQGMAAIQEVSVTMKNRALMALWDLKTHSHRVVSLIKHNWY